MSIAEQPVRVHPLAVSVLPLPAMVAVLIADGVGVGLAAVSAGLIVAAMRSPRLAATMLMVTIGMGAVLWIGFAVSLPSGTDPGETISWLPLHPSVEVALVALRGALRIVAILVLFTATAAWIRWEVLADTLVARGWVPYRLVDVVGLGGRFAVLMSSDLRTARTIARLRTRGRPLRAARLLGGLMIPVLMGAFRHADELTVAMDARGFGAAEERTTHHAAELRVGDAVFVAVVWALTTGAAVVMPV